jgi:hypothetical protein
MSTSENSETPPLTRRQLRELRNTGATPIMAPQIDVPGDVSTEPSPVEATPTPSGATSANAPASEDSAPEPAVEHPAAEAEPAPEPPAKRGGVLGGLFGRKADKPEDGESTREPAPVDEAATVPTEPADSDSVPVEQHIVPASFPPSDAGDLGVTGLTRRQARAQERIRTASVPIIAPELQPGIPAPSPEGDEAPGPQTGTPVVLEPEEPAPTDAAASSEVREGEKAGGLQAIFRPAAPDEASDTDDTATNEDSVSTIDPSFGSSLLSGQAPEISLPPSFDQLISRSPATTGSVSTPNALILSQTPAGAPLVGPITSTGEVLITGTFELPEGLGSAGHAPGTTDGRDIDAVLLDGELPPASSPTPIAASAAISTVKQPGEIIRPPAPEKGSKLVVGLIITTGALAVAVAVALVLAFTTGVFG